MSTVAHLFQVVAHILTFLCHADLKEARCVCKQWYEASLCPKIIDKETLVLKVQDGYQESEESAYLKFYLINLCKRDFYHVEVWVGSN